MIERLQARLAALAASGQTITYGALARELSIPGPGAIAQLTTALEMLMESDAQDGKPLRAAMCCGRLNGELPAAGFFDKAASLGCWGDVDAATFVAAERARLFTKP